MTSQKKKSVNMAEATAIRLHTSSNLLLITSAECYDTQRWIFAIKRTYSNQKCMQIITQICTRYECTNRPMFRSRQATYLPSAGKHTSPEGTTRLIASTLKCVLCPLSGISAKVFYLKMLTCNARSQCHNWVRGWVCK